MCQLPLFAAASAGLTITMRRQGLCLDIDVPVTDSPRLREAGRELLSLALMDARNHTLRLFAAWEEALAARDFGVPQRAELNPPLWELGHIGWFQEYWIARNVQRQRGARCDPRVLRLASIEPQADRWYDSGNVAHDTRWQLDLPGLEATKQYLLETLTVTLELLDAPRGAEDDAALYFYRLALFHEDMHGEAFAYMAQTLGFGAAALAALLPEPPPRAARAPLVFPATRWQLGCAARAGFAFDNEQWAHEVAVPEFEIDAQPVSLGQYVEFVEDGGYDEPRWWSAAGRAWLEGAGPAHAAPCRADARRRAGAALRPPAARAARAAGGARQLLRGRGLVPLGRPPPADRGRVGSRRRQRRLARLALGRGLGMDGERLPSLSGLRAGPVPRLLGAVVRHAPGVLRGASFATRARMRHPRYRNFYLPARDDIFVGFRSCAV